MEKIILENCDCVAGIDRMINEGGLGPELSYQKQTQADNEINLMSNEANKSDENADDT